MSHPENIQDRLTAVARASLDSSIADDWLSMVQPAIRLQAAQPAVVPAGGLRARLRRAGRDPESREPAAWLGGLPVLPAGTPWPSWPGHGPLAHVATLDCARLHPSLPPALDAAGFPSDGWLSFFYFDGSADGGIEPVGALFAGTEAGARVVYTPAGRDPEDPPLPAGISPYSRIELAARQILTWPTWEHPKIHAGGRPAPGWDEVFAVLDQIEPEQGRGPAHQIGGNPAPVQCPVELEVGYGLVSRGGQDKTSWSDPAVRQASDGWLLLAQFDSDDRTGFMWGDMGVLYYLIRPADLARQRFDRAAFTWQCG